jgi:hypothetical protein
MLAEATCVLQGGYPSGMYPTQATSKQPRAGILEPKQADERHEHVVRTHDLTFCRITSGESMRRARWSGWARGPVRMAGGYVRPADAWGVLPYASEHARLGACKHEHMPSQRRRVIVRYG